MCCSSVAREGEIPLQKAGIWSSFTDLARHLIPFEISLPLSKLDENDWSVQVLLGCTMKETRLAMKKPEELLFESCHNRNNHKC